MDDIQQAIQENAWLTVCIDCRQFAVKDTRNFREYTIPKEYENVTGGMCPECLRNYFARKGKIIEW